MFVANQKFIFQRRTRQEIMSKYDLNLSPVPADNIANESPR